ncbi:MAG: hypothetical protein ACFFAU_01630 [Candidatus Hodarchaeota archaeon]
MYLSEVAEKANELATLKLQTNHQKEYAELAAQEISSLLNYYSLQGYTILDSHGKVLRKALGQ